MNEHQRTMKASIAHLSLVHLSCFVPSILIIHYMDPICTLHYASTKLQSHCAVCSYTCIYTQNNISYLWKVTNKNTIVYCILSSHLCTNNDRQPQRVKLHLNTRNTPFECMHLVNIEYILRMDPCIIHKAWISTQIQVVYTYPLF